MRSGYSFPQLPPRQLSPTVQKWPQLPQFCASLRNEALFMHVPMHFVYSGAQSQKSAVQVSEKEH
jgi:hypothetical protein